MLVGVRPPVRRPLGEIPGGRRPLIALLDTGIGRHPWLRNESGDEGSTNSGIDVSGDSFVLDDDEFQDWIDIQEIDDGPDYGHGTFIAGIVRQACPDARVLNLRVMHDDGVVRQHDLTLALAGVLERNQAVQADIAAGRETDTSKFVDVVSLSAGYYPESSESAYTSRLFGLLKELSECGVLIVASAGNDSCDLPCFPAGMRFDVPGTPLDAERPPVVLSVGALDPDGKRAPFSNFGPWVRCWAAGAALISTMPISGGATGHAAGGDTGRGDGRKVLVAAQSEPPRDQLLHGPDEYDSGFALWSGTSFAAPLVAAELAGALITEAATRNELNLGRVDQKNTLERARSAFASVRSERATSA
jgi:subtilisin family serine protease